jgi:hypothetical protein
MQLFSFIEGGQTAQWGILMGLQGVTTIIIDW